MRFSIAHAGLLTTGVISSAAFAADPSLSNPALSLVLDGYYQTAERPMAEREEGFGLGETELALSASIDDMFYGKATAVFEEGELNLEEAFIQTLALPEGFSVRAGRFMSDIGYLNNQHLHTDSFSGRPVAYRAFLGGHYFDDGVRLDYLAPTELYWSSGLEAFKGESLRAEDETGLREFDELGVLTAFTKLGGDFDESSSWLLGLSYLHNRNGSAGPHQEEAVAEDDHDDHQHSAGYTGENTLSAALVYKWAPQGNYKYRHLTLSGEYFRVSGIQDDEPDLRDYHQGWYLSGAYQLSPSWSVAARYGELDAVDLEEEQLQKLKETELSLAWHHSHFSTVRLQYTHQQGTHFDALSEDNVLTLQYVMSLGAHSAHQF